MFSSELEFAYKTPLLSYSDLPPSSPPAWYCTHFLQYYSVDPTLNHQLSTRQSSRYIFEFLHQALWLMTGEDLYTQFPNHPHLINHYTPHTQPVQQHH